MFILDKGIAEHTYQLYGLFEKGQYCKVHPGFVLEVFTSEKDCTFLFFNIQYVVLKGLALTCCRQTKNVIS